MHHPFSVLDTIKVSWNVLKKNFTTLAVYSIISLFIYGVVDFITKFIFISESIINDLIFVFIQMLVQSYLALSFYKLILTLMDKEYYEFEFKEIWPSFGMAFRFIIIGLCYTVLIGTFLFINIQLQPYPLTLDVIKFFEALIIIYLLIRSIFCVCFIVDDDSQSFEALNQSFEITKDNFFNTLGIVIIILGVLIITLIPIVTIVGFFRNEAEDGGVIFKLAFYLWFVIAFPTVQVLIMVTYRKLVYSHQDVDDDIAETN
jgi:hypothetical protein